MADNVIKINNLSFSRGGRVIYDDVSLEIPRGKITAIMGPSGTGKTTLLKLIGGALCADKGEIWFNGQNISTVSRKQLYQVRRQLGMLFQSGALFTDLSVYDNVAFPIREHTDLPEQVIRTLVLMKLQAVGLRGAAQMFPHELSGGMARRAALARAIALDPSVVMYDEPFAGQDPIAMGVLLKLIKQLNDALHLTSIVVSHDVKEVLSIADYVYIIANSKVIASGSPEELKEARLPMVRQFTKGLPDGPVPFHYPASDYSDDLVWGCKR